MRFSIRDLLWLTVVVATLTVWWLDRRDLVNEIHALKAQQKMVMRTTK